MRALVLTAALLAAPLAQAAEPRPAPDYPPVSDAELDAARGGFLTPGGAVIGLGADVRTYVDGRLVLHTTLEVGRDGVLRSERIAGGPAPASAADLHAAKVNQGLDLSAFTGEDVFLVSDGTAVIHRLTPQALQNVLVNTADGLDVRQETALRVDVDAAFAAREIFGAEGLRLGFEIGDATRAGLGL